MTILEAFLKEKMRKVARAGTIGAYVKEKNCTRVLDHRFDHGDGEHGRIHRLDRLLTVEWWREVEGLA